MLIRNAEVWGHGLADVRIEGGVIAALNPPRNGEVAARRADGRVGSSPDSAEPAASSRPHRQSLRDCHLPVPGRILDAQGGALLLGLHDHHIHLAGLAARAASVWCGPPEIADRETLAQHLQAQPGTGWLRGIGYHESVMGLPGFRELDRLLPHRPLRIQHRSGRMWLLNSLALEALLAAREPPPGLERDGAGYSGRLFDEDAWLRTALASAPPDFAAVSAQLASHGVTGITDMIASGQLAQHGWLAGTLGLNDAAPGPWHLGPAKLHLHEAALPPFDEACAFITGAHRQRRGVAVHCTTEVELVYTLAAFEQVGTIPGDRIEHASIAAPGHIATIRDLGLVVCVQPHFVQERGDRYLLDVEPRHHGDLYRLASLSAAGIPLAGGSDAPFGSADPWAAMAAAVSRQTREGQLIGANEALTPEAALALYLAAPDDLARKRRIAIGEPADLCLLKLPWQAARQRLTSADVRATIIAGRLVHDSVDQAPT
jgi:predicted amidohydrolase YtcJ